MELGDLQEGETYNRHEIADAFETNFPAILPHIVPRRDKQDDRYILLFPTIQGPHNHEFKEDGVNLVGRGTEGSQKENIPGNISLIESIDEPTPIFLFIQYGKGENWVYQGPVDVVGYETDERDDREVFVFDIEHIDEPRSEPTLTEEYSVDYSGTSKEAVEIEKHKIQDQIMSEPRVTKPLEYSKTRRLARDYAFREIVLRAYEETCAVCGQSRKSPNGTPEVEAAHIYPKAEGGTDDPRNGVALCKLHHWAFDVGWIGINEKFEILVKQLEGREEFEEFKILEGCEINLPGERNLQPHTDFLTMGKEYRGFG